jgi:hypothetical protein
MCVRVISILYDIFHKFYALLSFFKNKIDYLLFRHDQKMK